MNLEFDKDYYKYLKETAKEDGVKVLSEDTPYGTTYNGITVAFCRATQGADCRMIHVSVSYCAKEDKYSKKIGKYQALSKLYRGESVQLPLGQFSLDAGNLATKELLISLFAV